MARLQAQLEEQKRLVASRDGKLAETQAAAEQVRRDAERSNAELQQELAERSRRLSSQKEELLADNTHIQLEGARLAAQNVELQAKADQLARQLYTSEQRLGHEQSKSLATLGRLATHDRLANARMSLDRTSPSVLERQFSPTTASTPAAPSATTDRVLIHSPGHEVSPSYYSWREWPAPSPPVLATYSGTSPEGQLPQGEHKVIYAVADVQ